MYSAPVEEPGESSLSHVTGSVCARAHTNTHTHTHTMISTSSQGSPPITPFTPQPGSIILQGGLEELQPSLASAPRE